MRKNGYLIGFVVNFTFFPALLTVCLFGPFRYTVSKGRWWSPNNCPSSTTTQIVHNLSFPACKELPTCYVPLHTSTTFKGLLGLKSAGAWISYQLKLVHIYITIISYYKYFFPVQKLFAKKQWKGLGVRRIF